MFETIGNFDTGRDPFGGDQKATVIAVIAALLDQFELLHPLKRKHSLQRKMFEVLFSLSVLDKESAS